MPEIGSQSQSFFAARIAGLWVCPMVGQIEVTENRFPGVTKRYFSYIRLHRHADAKLDQAIDLQVHG